MFSVCLFDIDIPFDGRESNKSGLDFHSFGLCKVITNIKVKTGFLIIDIRGI